MAEKKARVSARKVKDKWKAKGWYNLLVGIPRGDYRRRRERVC